MAAVTSPTSSFSLRPAEPGDFDAYMDVFEAVAAEGRWLGAEAPVDRESRRATFERAVAGEGSVLFVADAGGRIVGGISATLTAGVVDLGMFVAAAQRGGGVGRALLEAVIGWARRQGAHKLSLAAWPTNHAAFGLYSQAGFRTEGTLRRHYRRRSGALWDSVLMGLVLDEVSEGGPGRPAPPPAPIVVPAGGIRGRTGDREGAAVLLREWRRADAAAIVELVDDPAIRRWLPLPDPYTLDDALEYITGSRVALTAGTAAALAVTLDGRVVGAVGLRLDKDGGGTAEIGYWVGAAARGRGVAPAAAVLLSDFGVRALGLHRVELNAAVDNAASRRVADKAGFELEGIRRGWRTVGGVPADFALYGRISAVLPDDHTRRNGS